VMFFIRDKATIFRAPPALRTPLRDIIILFLRVFLSDTSLLQEEEEEEEEREWDIINAANTIHLHQPKRKKKRGRKKKGKNKKSFFVEG
jgi:hypothetical protein